MKNKSIQLTERHERLVAEAAEQRTALTQDMEPLRAPMALADRGVAALRYVGRHPGILIGAALVITAWQPRRVGKFLRFAMVGWQIGNRALRR